MYFITEYIFGFHDILTINSDYFPNSINGMVILIETQYIDFEEQT
jgi:hypothetical protein